MHPLLDIKGQIRECMNRTPIVVALDVTRLRGNDSKIVYQKLPTFIGMIEIKGYVGGAMISAGIGDDVADDIDSKEICAGLQQKYQVFFIYLQKGFEDRKADIDAAIQQRVEAVGGQYPNVDVRASLIWNNRPRSSCDRSIRRRDLLCA